MAKIRGVHPLGLTRQHLQQDRVAGIGMAYTIEQLEGNEYGKFSRRAFRFDSDGFWQSQPLTQLPCVTDGGLHRDLPAGQIVEQSARDIVGRLRYNATG
jgi:hypothetical protein